MRILLVLSLLLIGRVTSVAQAEERPPNVILLLADDLGWTGLQCFGSDFYQTPHLDALAKDGLRFTNAYAACTVCSPTRASIMTGIYPARLRLTDFIAGQNRPYAKMRIPDWTKGLAAEKTTIAEVLKQRGYVTAQVGKWHLSAPGKLSQTGPRQQGFDLAVDKPPKSRGYFLPKGFNKSGESKSDYATDYLTDRALQFIDSNRQRPFFLYMSYHTPHTPIQGRKDLVEKHRQRLRPGLTHNNPTYAAMVESLDQSVGRIVARLEEHGLTKNTVVIFTSDNGGLTQRYGKHDRFTENLPLRRGKGSAYEGGVRVPTIVRWPGVTAKDAKCDRLVMSIDWFPTLMEVARCKPLKGNRDGRSVVPLLKDPTREWKRTLYWHYPHYHAGGDGPYSAVRRDDWRLIHFHESNKIELYNLARELGEQTNLAEREPARATALLRELESWRGRVKAQMPTANPDYDAKRATQVRRTRNRKKK